MKDTAKLTGHVNLKLYDKNGILKDERDSHNVITTAGKTALATWLIQATQSDYFMRYVGVGTGTTGALAADTAIETEVGTRVAATFTTSTTNRVSSATFVAGNGTGAITEVGMLSASSSGTLFARQTFSAMNKAASDSLVFTWTLAIT